MTMEQPARIRSPHEQGLSTAVITRRPGISRNTVAKFLNRPSRPAYEPRASGARIASYQEYLQNRLTGFPELCTTILFEEICRRGYTGNYSVQRRFLQPLRKPMEVKVVLRFETPPGHLA